MSAAVFIFLWVQNEVSFDSDQPGENIYRITNSIQVSDNEAWVWESSPMLLAASAVKEIPEVQKSSRVIINSWGGPVLNVDHKLFTEKPAPMLIKLVQYVSL